jgi:hypothetical protein
MGFITGGAYSERGACLEQLSWRAERIAKSKATVNE